MVRREVRIRVLQTSNIQGVYIHTSQGNFSKIKYVSLTNTTRKEFIYFVINLGGTCQHYHHSPQYGLPKFLKC